MMGKVWFVTGSSRGLGLAIVKTALEAGDSVIATARKPEQLSVLVEKYGDRVYPIALDVGDNENVVKAVKTGHQHFGRIDVVINNAGYANHAALEDIDIDDFRQQVDTNFYGVDYVSKAVLPILPQAGLRLYNPGILGRGSGRYTWCFCLSSRKVGCGRFLNSPQSGDGTLGHQSYRSGAGRAED